MLRITNPTIKRLLLDQLVEQIDSGGLDDLLQAGFSPDFLDTMRHRPARDLIRLADVDGVEFRVSLEEAAITGYLGRLDRMRLDSKMLEYFVVNGAAVQVICNLFRRSLDEVRTLRSTLLSPEAQAGRKCMPAPEVRDRIHARWHELKRGMNSDNPVSMREALYQLHLSFPDCRIDALCRTLNEFDEEPSWQVTDFGHPAH